MRIGFDAKRAFLNSSGLGNYSRNLLNALYRYSTVNSYVLFTPEISEKLFEDYQRFEIHAPQSVIPKLVKPLWRSFNSTILKRNRIDLYHGLSNELPLGIHRTKIPSVVTIHDLIFLRYPEYYNFIDRKIYYWKVKYACSSASKIIAISEQTKDDIQRFMKIESSKIEVIYQPVSPVFFESKSESNLLKKYGLAENFILCVGTLESRKNQLSVLKAYHSAEFKTQLVFVGKQTIYRKKLDDYIQKNSLSESVVFLENISEKDLAGLYKMAFCSVFISLFEGFGLPVIEAMASGCPVITSNESCLPETAGGAAMLCAPEDTAELAALLKNIRENQTERQLWIDKGLNRARDFHPELFAHKMNEFYKTLLNSHE